MICNKQVFVFRFWESKIHYAEKYNSEQKYHHEKNITKLIIFIVELD